MKLSSSQFDNSAPARADGKGLSAMPHDRHGSRGSGLRQVQNVLVEHAQCECTFAAQAALKKRWMKSPSSGSPGSTVARSFRCESFNFGSQTSLRASAGCIFHCASSSVAVATVVTYTSLSHTKHCSCGFTVCCEPHRCEVASTCFHFGLSQPPQTGL